MSKPDLTLDHAHELLDRLTRSDDGAHVNELLELIHGVADPDNLVAVEVQKRLYAMTVDFQNHFNRYMSKIHAA